MQAARPNAILSPLQFGLGVQMHHHFGSKWLNDTLYKHGYSTSFSHVQNFERSATAMQGTDLPSLNGFQFGQFTQHNAGKIKNLVLLEAI